MAYIGIGYQGDEPGFLKECISTHMAWLSGDRQPRLYGDAFVVLYDSNTAREFARKCRDSAPENTIVVYPMEKPIESAPSVFS